MFNHTAEQLDANLFNDDRIDFQQYWTTIRNYQWRILSLAIVFTILSALIVLSVTPRYQATASLLIEAEQTKVMSIEEVYGLDSNRKEYFQTQFEILRSNQIAERVIEKLDLLNDPRMASTKNTSLLGRGKSLISDLKAQIKSRLPFLPQQPKVEKTPEQILQARKMALLANFSSNLTISPVKNTQVVNITFESESANLSATIANAVADVYIESYLQAKFTMTTKATTWLNDSLQGLREKLDSAEKRLADFYEEEQLVNIDGVVGLASEELQSLSEQLLDAQNGLKQSALVFEEINSRAGDIDTLSRLPVVQNHPSIQNLKRSEVSAQSRISELSRVYGPKHYRMIAANAELESIQNNLLTQLRTIIGGIAGDYENTYRNARNKVLDLQAEVDLAKARYRRLTTLDNRRRALQREVDINQQLYNSFFTRLKETSELGGFESANARILDPANPPARAAKPKKTLIVGAAFVFSLGLGIFLALALEALNSGIRSVDDVERKLAQRMLGIIPWQAHKRKKGLPLRHYFDTKHHTFSESMRTIRTNLLLLNVDQQSRVILVASSVPKEGKSTVAINLAFSLGQLGKTLIIDADLRRPTLAKQFGFPGFQPGLANVIAGTHEDEECIMTDEYSAVDVLPAGSLPPNPQELLASDRFKQLITKLRKDYNHIIIDTAPTQAVSDAMVISEVSDSLLYVVKADSTNAKTINNGLSRFLQVGHRVDGVVLNQVDLRKAKKTGDYAGFYDPYGYQSHAMESKAS